MDFFEGKNAVLFHLLLLRDDVTVICERKHPVTKQRAMMNKIAIKTRLLTY
jgi:hypothetical protein